MSNKKNSDFLETNGSLSNEDKVILKFGLNKLRLLAEDTIFTLLLGCVLKIAAESIIFQISFICLRTYGGGCHSKTEMRCKLHSALVTAGSLIAIKLLPNRNLWIYEVLFSVIIIFLAPVEAKNKPLSANEKALNRKYTIIITAVINILFVIGYLLNWMVLIKPLAVAVCAVGILMVIGRLTKETEKGKRLFD